MLENPSSLNLRINSHRDDIWRADVKYEIINNILVTEKK